MQATEELYYKDAYIREFEANVISSVLREDGVIEMVMDRTAFFPEAGGQSADTGVIEGVRVTDVQIDDSGVITHFCKPDDASVTVPAAGAVVSCSIDWERRHSFMQHHTGEHIFSGFVNRRFGYDNVGFHLSDNICTMDYNGVLSDEDIMSLECECNEQIYMNVPVSCTFPSGEELDRLAYRCKGELAPPVRIVTIEGADVCACCAPHVSNTGEIGVLKVLEAKSYKGGVRITLVCGKKAFSDYRKCFMIIGKCKKLLSAGTDELPERIVSLQEANASMKYDIISLHENNLRNEAEAVSADEYNAILFAGSAGTKAMRSTVNTLMEQHKGICGVFCGSDEDGYEFILGSTHVDMREINSVMKEKLASKCGGSDRMIQGHSGATRERISDIIEQAGTEYAGRNSRMS